MLVQKNNKYKTVCLLFIQYFFLRVYLLLQKEGEKERDKERCIDGNWVEHRRRFEILNKIIHALLMMLLEF